MPSDLGRVLAGRCRIPINGTVISRRLEDISISSLLKTLVRRGPNGNDSEGSGWQWPGRCVWQSLLLEDAVEKGQRAAEGPEPYDVNLGLQQNAAGYGLPTHPRTGKFQRLRSARLGFSDSAPHFADRSGDDFPRWVHGAVLLAFPSLPAIAVGLWWNANTISHNFIHRSLLQ
jgi:hypothetical protein